MIIILTAATILVAQATPDAPQTPPAAPAQAQAAAEASKASAASSDKVVCRNEAPLGSIVPKKVCWRASDVERNRANAKAAIERMRTSIRGPGS